MGKKTELKFVHLPLDLNKYHLVKGFYFTSMKLLGLIWNLCGSRYWHDQAVYAMARSFDGIIPAKSIAYEFPKDLLRPDYIFFLNGALNPGVHNESTTKEHIHNPLTLK